MFGVLRSFMDTPITRKYVDLILKETCMWASYRPSRADGVQVGDYGEINEENGEFIHHGNIYDNESVLKRMPELREARCQPQISAPLRHWIIRAKAAEVQDLGVEASAGLAGGAEVAIDFEVKYENGRRGAVLAMYAPRERSLPNTVDLFVLSAIPEIQKRGKVLVTAVVSCPAFALQISSTMASSCRMRFRGSLPCPAAPVVSPGGSVTVGWENTYSGDICQEGCNKNGEYVYSPLFQLKKRKKGKQKGFRRGDRGNADWVPVKEPWGLLDEDGNRVNEH